MKVLLFGFGPFPGVEYNHTSSLAQEIEHNEPSPDRCIKSCVLPVDFTRVTAIVEREITDFQPDYTVIAGIRANAEKIYFEKTALNIVSSSICDNFGNFAGERYVLENEREAFFTAIDIARIKDKLEHIGINCAVSYHSGTYLCNQAYYVSCFMMDKLKGKPDSLLIHVPPVDCPETGYDVQYRAVKAVIDFLR